ncbi:hypothetical protein C8Q79DRAFT_777735 [Trametes meyenii]|nr:hypothetical protein C8Q79DRAFT_777735 [Trametes meyenii]
METSWRAQRTSVDRGTQSPQGGSQFSSSSQELPVAVWAVLVFDVEQCTLHRPSHGLLFSPASARNSLLRTHSARAASTPQRLARLAFHPKQPAFRASERSGVFTLDTPPCALRVWYNPRSRRTLARTTLPRSSLISLSPLQIQPSVTGATPRISKPGGARNECSKIPISSAFSADATLRRIVRAWMLPNAKQQYAGAGMYTYRNARASGL